MQVKQESTKNQRLTRPLGKPAGERRINGRAVPSYRAEQIGVVQRDGKG